MDRYEDYPNVIPGTAKHFVKVTDDNYALFRVCLLTINIDKKVEKKDGGRELTTTEAFAKFCRDNLKLTIREF